MSDLHDRSRRFRVMPPPADDQHVELRVKVRFPKWVKILSLLLAAAGGPAAVLGGILPWGMRWAGAASSADIAALKVDLAAAVATNQQSDAVDAKSLARVMNELESTTASVSRLSVRVEKLLKARRGGDKAPQ